MSSVVQTIRFCDKYNKECAFVIPYLCKLQQCYKCKYMKRLLPREVKSYIKYNLEKFEGVK